MIHHPLHNTGLLRALAERETLRVLMQELERLTNEVPCDLLLARQVYFDLCFTYEHWTLNRTTTRGIEAPLGRIGREVAGALSKHGQQFGWTANASSLSTLRTAQCSTPPILDFEFRKRFIRVLPFIDHASSTVCVF